jgi:hypothetical protein
MRGSAIPANDRISSYHREAFLGVFIARNTRTAYVSCTITSFTVYMRLVTVLRSSAAVL